jgi:threonine aldolase
VQANLVFPRMSAPLCDALRGRGFEFLDWPALGADVVRLVCGFATRAADVDALIDACRG